MARHQGMKRKKISICLAQFCPFVTLPSRPSRQLLKLWAKKLRQGWTLGRPNKAQGNDNLQPKVAAFENAGKRSSFFVTHHLKGWKLWCHRPEPHGNHWDLNREKLLESKTADTARVQDWLSWAPPPSLLALENVGQVSDSESTTSKNATKHRKSPPKKNTHQQQKLRGLFIPTKNPGFSLISDFKKSRISERWFFCLCKNPGKILEIYLPSPIRTHPHLASTSHWVDQGSLRFTLPQWWELWINL